MALPVYLAMTASEFAGLQSLPKRIAWMACHFSCYGTGLSNLPQRLPEGAMLIVNDRMPIDNHDPQRIADELASLTQTLPVGAILLDFQQENCPALLEVAKAVTRHLALPVGVTEYYAQTLDCAVFLPPPAPHCCLKAHLAPWQGRQIWLEAAMESQILTVTRTGTKRSAPMPYQAFEPSFENTALHCRYHTAVTNEQVVFTLFRTRQCLHALLNEAEQLGVCRAVGLYQQLENWV